MTSDAEKNIRDKPSNNKNEEANENKGNEAKWEPKPSRPGFSLKVLYYPIQVDRSL